MYDRLNQRRDSLIRWPHQRLLILAIMASVITVFICMNISSVNTCTLLLISIVIYTLFLFPSIAWFIIVPLIRNHDSLWEISNIDILTQVYNRRYFQKILGYELNRAERYNRPLSVILLDIDNFKDVNDTYGHGAGDQVLINIARVIKDRLRNYCTLARYGGEEFVIIAPETSKFEVMTCSEQIRRVVQEASTIVDSQCSRVSVTISLGCATFDPEIDNNIEQLINRADVALYDAKNSGKNKTVYAEYKTVNEECLGSMAE